jgi:hypothetical protein
VNYKLSQDVVLAKAVLRAAKRLGLNKETLINTIKINNASNIVELDPTSESSQRGLLLIQLFQSLYSLTDGEEAAIKIFMNSKNHLTEGIPIEQIEEEFGLIKVVECVESLTQQEF